jgi:hypothetical protein
VNWKFYEIDAVEFEELKHLKIISTPTVKRHVFDTTHAPLPEDMLEMREWCAFTFGDDEARWGTDEWGLVAFRDHSDAIAFKMRWM